MRVKKIRVRVEKSLGLHQEKAANTTGPKESQR
jgi:hypothetical protein